MSSPIPGEPVPVKLQDKEEPEKFSASQKTEDDGILEREVERRTKRDTGRINLNHNVSP